MSPGPVAIDPPSRFPCSRSPRAQSVFPRILTILFLIFALPRTPLAAAPQGSPALSPSADPSPRPNIVIIFCDDLGYADVGCFGAERIRTPHIDRLARDGVRLTDFYVAQAVCSASRAALLTGCYPNRVGIAGALDHRARTGLHPEETTLAEVLRPRGYATAIVGKWHLGHHPEFLPTRQGFDEWLGLPYSNDMWPFHPEAKPGSYPPLPLFDGESIIDDHVTAEDQQELTTRYTRRAVDFIQRNRDRPFFLYLAHSMPHVPLFVSASNHRRSRAGLYGQVVREIDDSVGAITDTLRRLRLADRTLVIFTSDNGPWLSYGDHAGSTGPLREGKGTSWDGGIRVPFIARWPGHIPRGSTCHEPAMTIDLLPTIARFAGAPLPPRRIDGQDIGPLLTQPGSGKRAHQDFWIYYAQNELQAIRSGPWKLILPHTYRTLGPDPQPRATGGKPVRYQQAKAGLELYHLPSDPGESRDVAAQHPEILERLQAIAETARADLGDSLTSRAATGARPPGRLDAPTP